MQQPLANWRLSIKKHDRLLCHVFCALLLILVHIQNELIA